MDNIKYTSDGKKVVIIGALNNQEKIVQEVFISNGCEIPSGEHFVASSLHDAPVLSWKAAEIKKIDAHFDSRKSEVERELKILNGKYKEKCIELREKIRHIGLTLKNADESAFNQLVDFITGETKWVVVEDYGFDLLPIDKFSQTYEDKLRLFSIFGKNEGQFTYAVGQYYDYSGNHKRFTPFSKYEDALSFFEEKVLGCSVSEKNILALKKFGLSYSEQAISEYKLGLQKQIADSIDSLKKQILEKEDQLLNVSEI